MKTQKAISAMIATVILVAFTVSVAVIVTSFLTGVIKFQTGSVSTQAVCAQKGSILVDTAMCTRVPDNSLVGYWKLDSVNGTNYTLDSTNYDNDGSLGGGNATASPWLANGQINNGLQFDGANDYVDAGNGASLNITNAITVSVWVKPNALSTDYDTFVEKFSTGTTWAYMLSFTDVLGKVRFRLGTNSLVSYSVSSIGNWYYIVGTYSSSDGSMKLYINGNLDNSSVYSGSINSSSNSVIIGKSLYISGREFNGTIDEVRIYNRSLSADEIQQLYQNGLQEFAPDGYVKTIKASVRNIGSTPLSNFTIFADINGRFYQNDTPQNGGTTLPPASEPLTLQANTYYDGPIRTLKVSVLNCPISMTLTNDSGAVGTC